MRSIKDVFLHPGRKTKTKETKPEKNEINYENISKLSKLLITILNGFFFVRLFVRLLPSSITYSVKSRYYKTSKIFFSRIHSQVSHSISHNIKIECNIRRERNETSFCQSIFFLHIISVNLLLAVVKSFSYKVSSCGVD